MYFQNTKRKLICCKTQYVTWILSKNFIISKQHLISPGITVIISHSNTLNSVFLYFSSRVNYYLWYSKVDLILTGLLDLTVLPDLQELYVPKHSIKACRFCTHTQHLKISSMYEWNSNYYVSRVFSNNVRFWGWQSQPTTSYALSHKLLSMSELPPLGIRNNYNLYRF